MALYEIEKNSSGVPTGNYKYVAGRGKAEYGASTVRSGEFTIPAKEAGSASWVQITFAEPMPDTNYEVEFTLSHYWDACSLIPFDKETTGFKAQVGYIQAGAGLSNRTVTYTAYRLYTDTEYNNILVAMPSDASASNKLVTESDLPKQFVVTTGSTTFSMVMSELGLSGYPNRFAYEVFGSTSNKCYSKGIVYRDNSSTSCVTHGYTSNCRINTNNGGAIAVYDESVTTPLSDARIVFTRID